MGYIITSMNILTYFPDGFEELPDVKPFALMRDDVLPALERNRPALEALYDTTMGRPEIDPVER
ncbi:MAG: hypothetical protein E4H02_06535 [Lentisphaerales bacterium]|jgi:hypothetical protein|nr:MAG: hypothetical protein E4H02_06535 [Lentisphaerales bacterium]